MMTNGERLYPLISPFHRGDEPDVSRQAGNDTAHTLNAFWSERMMLIKREKIGISKHKQARKKISEL